MKSKMFVFALLCATPVMSAIYTSSAKEYMKKIIEIDSESGGNQIKSLQEGFSLENDDGIIDPPFEIKSLEIEYSDELHRSKCQQTSTYDATSIICQISVDPIVVTFTAKVKEMHSSKARKVTLKSTGQTSCRVEFHGSPEEEAQEVDVSCEKVSLVTTAEVSDRIRRKLGLDDESVDELVKRVGKKLKRYLSGDLPELLEARFESAADAIMMPWP